MVHNRAFYTLELLVSLLLMSLAFFEEPSVVGKVAPYKHGIPEAILLVVISIESFLKSRWMGPKVFFRHKRSMIKV